LFLSLSAYLFFLFKYNKATIHAQNTMHYLPSREDKEVPELIPHKGPFSVVIPHKLFLVTKWREIQISKRDIF